MNERNSGDFSGFVTPEGEIISLTDVDRMYTVLSRRTDKGSEIIERMWELAQECSENGHHDAAYRYIVKILPLTETDGERAQCLLSMGQARESAGDLLAAQEVYSQAFALPSESNLTWYFLNNNLGFCLNHAGNYKGAARHCRLAIRIDRRRHNAHKNLGIALYGLKKYVPAARCFIRATLLCPQDGRALSLLEGLLASHTEVLEQDPRLLDLLLECHQAVHSVSGPMRPQ
jgi:tetratricopeptide (TPR) repeat protein